ncbi:SpoIIE family protein phosphatase [Chloroflexales bacterium ZM16-3]|nr:SpoIIE family protein phosphatase [Chloroflexales bacterium ZM16-3]
MRRRNTSITTWLRWSYLISSTLPLLLVGALLIGVLFQVQQRNAYASQQAVADQIAGNVSTFLYDLEQLLLRAARDLHPEMPGPDLDATAARLVNSSPDLRALVIVDTSGAQVASAVSSLLRDRGDTIAPSEADLLKQAFGVGQGGRTSIMRADDGTPYFQVVLPIRSQSGGVLVGALSAEVSATRINQILRLAVQGGNKISFLINAGRSLMLASTSSGWSPADDMAVLFANESTVGEYHGANGERMVGARSIVSPVTPSSWSVVVEEPSAEFLTEVYRSVFLLTAVVALVGLLALAWALYQARQIVRPVRALADGARELGGGQLEHRIIVESRDELGQLADTFNQMAEQLQGSLHEIADQNERLLHGLILARDIQMGLMPSSPPWKSEVLTVHARSLPASEVGGDFYTYMALPGGRAAVAIGDISGKGVAAALLMALTSSTLESQARVLEHPGAMLAAIHDSLHAQLQANHMNAALMIAIYDPTRQSMAMANAGMISPLLVRALPDGGIDCHFVDVSGLPIGTLLPTNYCDVEVDLAPGDTMIFLSDGIVEAHNPASELYGFERLEELVSGMPHRLSVADIVQRILDSVLAFTDGADPHDDITILVTRRTISAAAYEAQFAVTGTGFGDAI